MTLFTANPSTYPNTPGVYLFKNEKGRVLYVGKAKDLRRRISSYCKSEELLPLKTRSMLRHARSLDTLCTQTEKEALLLEASLIKKHRPRYNIVLRDDKEYVLFKLNRQDPYPRLSITRRTARDGALYFGPFSSAKAARETWKIVNRLFPLRKCRDRAFRNRVRPCLQYNIKRCLAPCVRPVAEEQYARIVKQVELFLSGQSGMLIRQLENEMQEASGALEFERAALLRDQIGAINKTVEQQAVVFADAVDRDVIALCRKTDGWGLGVVFIRQGKMLDQKNFALSTGSSGIGMDVSDPEDECIRPGSGISDEERELMGSFLIQYYWHERFVPDLVLIPFDMETDILEEILSERSGKKVRIRKVRGEKERSLVSIAATNVRMEREPRERGYEKPRLRKALRLDSEPERIEAVDASHLSGQGMVVGQVVYEGSGFKKGAYRLYAFPELEGTGDDFAALRAWVARRIQSGPPWPDLVLIDGGKGQLAAVKRSKDELLPDTDGYWQLAALSKGERRGGELEEFVFVPGRKNHLPLKPGSKELLFLQYLRDSVHRFVLSRQRRTRKRKIMDSGLEELPGIGPKTARLLWDRYGSIDAMLSAPVEDLLTLPGVGPKRAAAIHNALKNLQQKQDAKRFG